MAAYNAAMGRNSAVELDAWMRSGGLVVASSDRAARAVRARFHRARRAEGREAWASPEVLDWNSFVRSEWEQRKLDRKIILNAVQEESLWADVIAASGHTTGWLDSPRRRLASLAMGAHDLVCSYAPRFLKLSARAGWQNDAAAFSEWLTVFDKACTAGNLICPSRLPVEMLKLLKEDESPRPPLMLAGFDRILPVQLRVFEAWGAWSEPAPNNPATDVLSFVAADEHEELSACARWCRDYLKSAPRARLLVIAPDAKKQRGELERAFRQQSDPSQQLLYEFSLGVPLSQVAAVRSAKVLLEWLHGSIEEQGLDWLFSSGYAADPVQSMMLQASMRTLRRRGLERTQWSLRTFLRQSSGFVPERWAERMTEAANRLEEAARSLQSPLEWADLVPHLLETMGWLRNRQPSSAEMQAANRWQQAIDLCGSLGFNGRKLTWGEFLSELKRIVDETLYAPESEDAPIVIAGPAESAGLTADAIWFLSANEDTWPARGSTHPLLPLGLQREERMPYASPQLDWELADSITQRLLGSAHQVRFSRAHQKEAVETRISRLVAELPVVSVPLPIEYSPTLANTAFTESFIDYSRIPLTPAPPAPGTTPSLFPEINESGEVAPILYEVRGGSTVLTSQSQCPFKAFATARLGAQGWEPAEAGLTAAQRGQLLHAVLHAIWGGGPHGIRSLDEMPGPSGVRPFVATHVERVLAERMPLAARERMPKRYLELEEQRLTLLVSEWLEYERTRMPFTVAATEREATTTIAGLTLKLRLDRVDRLNDDTFLVIDYKTGNVSPNSWDLPRPDDVQLPLYAGFALGRHTLGGLVFAKVRAGNMCITGKVGAADATLFAGLKSNSALQKNALTAEELIDWKKKIEQLAHDFLAGRADVDPRDFPNTCKRCGLYTLCRVRERDDEPSIIEEADDAEANDD